MVKDMNTAEILRAAAARVRQGWCQDQLDDGIGVCAFGALNTVLHGHAHYIDADPKSLELAPLIMRACGLPGPTRPPYVAEAIDAVIEWNNAEGQTAENVAAGLEYAALVWEQQQQQQHEAQPVIAHV